MAIRTFQRLEQRLDASEAHLADNVVETVRRTCEAWLRFADELASLPKVRDAVSASIAARGRSLLRR